MERIIPLSLRGEVVGLAVVSAEDYEVVAAHRWRPHNTGYAVSATEKSLLLHRLIMRPGPGMVVDHRNGDVLDNRRQNLRLATRAENARNQVRLSKNNTSGHVGVSWNRGTKSWYAYITVDKKMINLGLFSEMTQAIAAREAAERKYYGDFAPIRTVELPLPRAV